MTTIAFDGKTLAVDSRAVGHYVDDKCKKLFEINGSFYAFSGRHTEAMSFINWRREGGEKPKIEEEIYVFEVTEEAVFYWEKNLVRIPYYAPCGGGSGGIIAMTAMLCGKTAFEAVEMAKILDENTGGDVQFVNIKQVTVVSIVDK